MQEINLRYAILQLEYGDMLYELSRRMDEVTRLLHEALTTDEKDQKQWYLCMIAETLKIDMSDVETLDKGVAP